MSNILDNAVDALIKFSDWRYKTERSVLEQMLPEQSPDVSVWAQVFRNSVLATMLAVNSRYTVEKELLGAFRNAAGASTAEPETPAAPVAESRQPAAAPPVNGSIRATLSIRKPQIDLPINIHNHYDEIQIIRTVLAEFNRSSDGAQVACTHKIEPAELSLEGQQSGKIVVHLNLKKKDLIEGDTLLSSLTIHGKDTRVFDLILDIRP